MPTIFNSIMFRYIDEIIIIIMHKCIQLLGCIINCNNITRIPWAAAMAVSETELESAALEINNKFMHNNIMIFSVL